ncbi:MAG TPA: GNAT family protein [bacterium]|nr:GNAT family protein [bacterium]
MRLIPAGPEHAPLYYAWRQEPSSRAYNPLDDIDIDALTTRLTNNSCDLTDHTRSSCRWMVEHSDRLIGTVALHNISWRNGYGELGYMVGEAWQGQGLGTAMVRLAIDHIFDHSVLRRLFATISSENTASLRLVEKLGFTREGTLREHYLIQGRHHDEVVYGLLRREWKAQEQHEPRC